MRVMSMLWLVWLLIHVLLHVQVGCEDVIITSGATYSLAPTDINKLPGAYQRSLWDTTGLGMFYNHEGKPDWIVYSFDFSSASIAELSKKSTQLSAELEPPKSNIPSNPEYCADLIHPGTVLMGGYGQIEFRAKDPNDPNWRNLRNELCCKGGSVCPGCYRHSGTIPNYLLSGEKAVMSVIAVINKVEVQLMFKILCQYCCQYACAKSFCDHGEYVSTASDLDPITNLELRKLQCTPCAPGTWNTCKYKPSCVWYVPQNDFSNLTQDIHTIGKGPIGGCYPCSWAGVNLFHYTNSPTLYSVINPDKPWKCPGGASPPINCKGDDKVRSLDYARCVCKDGTFGTEDTACVPCPPGFYCVDGAKTKCDDHQYQPLPGAKTCLNCVDSGDKTGVYKGCGDGAQLEWCLQSKAGTQDKPLPQNCRPCHQCARTFITPVGGEVNCYKS